MICICYLKATKTLREQADAVTRARCCKECCVLKHMDYDTGKQFVFACMQKRASMTRSENKDDLRELIKVSIDNDNDFFT